MKKNRGALLLAFLIAAAAVFASCDRGGSGSKLVGKWRPPASPGQVMEFKSDGTFVGPPYVSGQPPVTGRYEFEGENKIRLTAPTARVSPSRPRY